MRRQNDCHSGCRWPATRAGCGDRLEERMLLTRVLCAEDRRGIYTELTTAGHALHDRARPVHDAAPERALASARQAPELAGLVDAIAG